MLVLVILLTIAFAIAAPLEQADSRHHPDHPFISPWRQPPHPDHVRRNPRAYSPRPESAINKSWDGRVHTDCVDSSMVALTFDDGVKYPFYY